MGDGIIFSWDLTVIGGILPLSVGSLLPLSIGSFQPVKKDAGGGKNLVEVMMDEKRSKKTSVGCWIPLSSIHS